MVYGLILAFPVIFTLGLLPQINTAAMFILEQIDIHVRFLDAKNLSEGLISEHSKMKKHAVRPRSNKFNNCHRNRRLGKVAKNSGLGQLSRWCLHWLRSTSLTNKEHLYLDRPSSLMSHIRSLLRTFNAEGFVFKLIVTSKRLHYIIQL